jgi:CBS domain-containing protein
MNVSSLLKVKGTSVVTVPPDATIATVVHELRARGIGALVVTQDGRRVLGLIAERDIVHGLAEHGPRLLGMRVVELMERAVVTCAPDDTIATVMGRMTHQRARHLPVVEHGQLRGLVSIGDVVKHRLDDLETETHILREMFLAR